MLYMRLFRIKQNVINVVVHYRTIMTLVHVSANKSSIVNTLPKNGFNILSVDVDVQMNYSHNVIPGFNTLIKIPVHANA